MKNGFWEILAEKNEICRLQSDELVQVKLCFEGQLWDLLCDTIMSYSKKRLLIKVAIAKMVRDCCEMVEKMPTEELRMKLIDTLRTVTAGKIYVEVERARLTQLVVKKLESEGRTNEACDMLLELQVETYGSMQIQEKVQYLLEQMRLSLARSDFVRASIISKKINVKFFNSDKDEIQDMKLKYYELMIRIALNDRSYLDICKHYRAVFDTNKINQDPTKSKETLKRIIIYCILAPYDNEQWDLMNRVAGQRELENVSDYKTLLDLFINQELISWKGAILNTYEKLLRRGTSSSTATGVFDSNPDGEKHWSDLHLRVGEQNLRMIAKYYTRISFDRLAELIDFPVDEMEKFLCEMIVSGAVQGRIHRPSKIVDLSAKSSTTDVLDQWGHGVTHLIQKEQMVHKNLDLLSIS
ncbi:hypothetical protein WR25_18750 [Diploscapter pachys]|uniref:PCI domain-containing protein n=1 Tax=Diploscapter pachys TaxID=2018661 RepID=A0A2A2KT06_9BILA|nr:hypothetical protein WR25_18750 [Diploscapter pachys]